MYKNICRVPAYFDGKKGYTLLGPDGRELLEARHFCRVMIIDQGKSSHTIGNYMFRLGHFLDFLYEATELYAGEHPTEWELHEIIKAWDPYLQRGENSGNNIARRVAETLPREPLSASSSRGYHDALKCFLLVSEDLRQRMRDMEEAGLIDPEVSISSRSLFPGMGARRKIPIREHRAMIQHDMYAAVVKNGPKYARASWFPAISVPKGARYEETQAFPLAEIAPLIRNASSLRNRCIYSLAAASGGRISEVLQVRRRDIDFAGSKVYLTNHSDVLGDDDGALHLTEEQRYQLSYKGRETRETFLLAPYERMFFEYLEEYWDRMPYTEDHDFIFCAETAGQWAKPLWLCHYSSIYRSFQEAVERTQGEGASYSPKSLRHAYGFYLVNYCPNPETGGYGLDIGLVNELMAHAEIRNTQKYAVKDAKLRRYTFEAANRLIYEDSDLSLNEHRLLVIQRIYEKQQDLVARETAESGTDSEEHDE